MRKSISFILFCLLAFISSCTDKLRPGSEVNYETVTHKIALIYPFSRQSSIDKLVEWAEKNASYAQQGMSRRIALEIERYDEESVDLAQLGKTLASRNDIAAVIGPEYSDDMTFIAMNLANSDKVLISPWATSSELARQYAGKDFFWSLVESDITQCEILLSRALNYGCKKVSLIATSTTYGNSFNDWLAFQATEMGIDVIGIYMYDPESEDLTNLTKQALSDGCDALICVPGRVSDAYDMLRARNTVKEMDVQMLFSDVAFQEELLLAGEEINFAEGTGLSGDPETGFGIAYSTKFGTHTYEPHLYDAFLILYMAFTSLDAGRTSTLKEAIKDVVRSYDTNGVKRPSLICWDYEGLHRQLEGLRTSTTVYDIIGASGDLDFNIDLQSVLRTTYIHWMAFANKFIAIDYLATDGSHHTDNTLPSWQWNVENIQSFSDTKTFSYPEHKDNWALLIATSSGWLNYRHQADVLQVYGLLKSHGYDDDHIILIMEDDLRYNSQNKNQGQVRDYDGYNLYPSTVELDYKLSELHPDDIKFILTGQKSDRLTKVLSPTENDNIFVFWSGHGVKEALSWGSNNKQDSMTYDRMSELLKEMKARGCYRKMLWQIETCYSASVGLAASAEDIPGVMIITAADVNETSKADLFKDGIYYTDRFSKILYDAVKANPDISYRDLYYEMVKSTTGSHPRIINNNNYDNLFKTGINEYFN